MVKQIEPRLGEPRIATLDRRLAELEARLAALVEAVQELARGLEDGQPDGRAGKQVAEAARRADQLLSSSHRPGKIRVAAH